MNKEKSDTQGKKTLLNWLYANIDELIDFDYDALFSKSDTKIKSADNGSCRKRQKKLPRSHKC